MKKRSPFSSSNGFTVIELTVSLGIMIAIMTTVFANYPESNVRVNLGILAHTITLSMREMQVRSTAIESKDMSIGGYGLFFDLASSTHLVSFNDFATESGPNDIDVGDGLYATSSTPGLDETETITTFPYKFKIGKLCVGTGYPFNGTNNGSCNNDASSGLPSIGTLTVGFIRPDPRPMITINQLDGTNHRSSTSSSITGACIEITSEAPNRSPYTRSAQIYTTGRIVASKQGCQ